jgi:hypothetical protein
MTTQPSGRGWTANDSTFGARLALVRQRMGWGNVKEAAVACGLPVESWRNWERDGRLPRDLMGVGQAVSARSGCDLGWLIGMYGGQGPTASGRPGNVTPGDFAEDAVSRRYLFLPITKAA